ncbi:MAG: DUF3883 domain-containing protein [Hormoscilla sp.]
MASPQEIIEDIRKNTYGIGLSTDAAAKGVIDSLKKSLNSALERLSVDLYSKETHFVLELLQNADDNEYRSDVNPTLTITIAPEKIIVVNNECGFTEANVRAICDVGNSTKSRAIGYIGEKGIGFKSVFRISDEPQIFSNGFQFKFKHQDDRDQLGFVAPYWIEEIPPEVDIQQTNIILPLRESAKDELWKLNQIEHTLILFLRQLKRVKIDNQVENKFSQISRTDAEGKVAIASTTGSEVKQHDYKIVSQTLRVPEDIQEEKRSNVRETELILAFKMKADGTADATPEQKVYAFLPTRSYGFKFLIQGDFLVPANREDIHKDKLWNKWLRDCIARVFLSAVDEFKRERNLSYYNYIPLVKEVKDRFFAPVVEEIHAGLKATACMLTASGNWRLPAEVLRPDEQIRELIANEDLQQILNKEYRHPQVTAKGPILDSLGVKKFGIDEAIACLSKTQWLSAQSDDWFVKLYLYLNSKSYYLAKVKHLRIIRLENGRLASASETSIFFPLEQGEYGFELSKSLQVVRQTLLSDSGVAVREFMKKMGVQDTSAYDIIENYILPIYQRGADKGDRGYLRYIKDNLSAYETKKKREEWGSKDPLEKLQSSLWIKTDRDSYARPRELYLPKGYGNENDLESLLSGIKDVQFVSLDYLADLAGSEKYAEMKKWREFFVKLGVQTIPKIDVDVKTASYKSNQGQRLTHEYPVYRSPHILGILASQNEAKNRQLAKILDKNWNYYQQHKQWTYYYFDRGKSSWEPGRTSDADWFAQLKTVAWLPTTNGTMAKPGEVFLSLPETVSILGDTVPYLAIALQKEELIQDLGIKAKMTDPKDYADLLLELSQNQQLSAKSEQILIKIYQELNNHIATISPAAWWRSFISKRIFWTERSGFCAAGNLFVNDNEEIYQLFRDRASIAFLKLPNNYYPQIQQLIKAVGIRYLSQAVKTELATESAAIMAAASLTTQIQRFTPYIWRYLYQLEYDTYEKLKSDGSLVKFKDLTCYQVDRLEIQYTLNQQSAKTQGGAFLDNSNLYIRSDGDTDSLAVELSKLFGNPKGLDEFLMLLFYKQHPADIERLMKTKQIQSLPTAEISWWETISTETDDTEDPGSLEGDRVTEGDRVLSSEGARVLSSEGDRVLSSEGDRVTEGDRVLSSEGTRTTETSNEDRVTEGDRETETSNEDREPAETITASSSPEKRKQRNELPDPEIVLESSSESKDASSEELKSGLTRSTLKSTQGEKDASEERKIEIWGEKYALEYLKKKYSEKYPQGELAATESGFAIALAGKNIVEVNWLNQIGDKGEAYDLKVVENGNPEYIEVKASKPGSNKNLVKLYGWQWKFAASMGEKFHIYRVYNAGTPRARLADIANPTQLWQQGNLRVDSVYLRM